MGGYCVRQSQLAAILFERGNIDLFLAGLARTLTASGVRVRDAVQSPGATNRACRCADMDLTMLHSRKAFRISQPLETGSHGCRLDPGALAECSAFIEENLRSGADLLILNRFGRGESQGCEFRNLIGTAVGPGVPMLTVVRPITEGAWVTYGATVACTLPMVRKTVLDWAIDAQQSRNAA